METIHTNHLRDPVIASPLNVDRVFEVWQCDEPSRLSGVHGSIVLPDGSKCNYCCSMEAEERAPEEFRRWLERQLARRDWSPAEFARRLGMNTGTVSRWMTGSRRPRTDACDKIADVLGVDVDVVLTMAGHRPPDIELDPDSATARLMPLIEQIDWDARPGRLEGLEFELRQMIEWDRMKKDRT